MSIGFRYIIMRCRRIFHYYFMFASDIISLRGAVLPIQKSVRYDILSPIYDPYRAGAVYIEMIWKSVAGGN